MMNPLLDNEFINDLITEKQREVFIKIIALNFNENPIEEITGHVTQGSISVDGASAIRRTCSLSMVAQDLNINDYYWGLNTKVQIEIGLSNFINLNYPDIIWFKQGIFILTSFNTSQAINGWNVSLQGKDKMCLLNGDIGGTISALSWDFGSIQEEDIDNDGNGLGTYSKKDFLLKDIIIEAVHEFAKEPYRNIIVNDLDDVGLELMEYRGDTAIYFLVNLLTNEVDNYRFADDITGYYYEKDGENIEVSLNNIPYYDERITLDFGKQLFIPTTVYAIDAEEKIPYSVIKVTYGDVVGYRITNLTYAGDLIASVGNAITSAVLDKIKNQLGDFEYFYNVDGQFIFQRKKTYINTSFNNLKRNENNENYADNAMYTSSFVFSFENSNLITAFQNNPDLNNIKNDYSIWGTRKSSYTGTEIPVHLRYAIDTKPIEYTTYEGITYTVYTLDEYLENSAEVIKVKQEIEESLKEMNNYKKPINPNGLPDDWWDILEWAKFYEILYGEHPTGRIGDYANAGNGGANVPKTDLVKYFPLKERPSTSELYFQSNPIYIFDVDYIQGKSYIGYTGHGTGCNHPYSYFTQRAYSGVGTSYIYKPTIPSVLAEKKYEEYLEKIYKEIDEGNMRCSCDWRELIYQMARDNSLYGHNDDFEATIIKNNGDLYPNGETGYEQYYVDIYSFWRDLYNPDPDYFNANEFYIELPKAQVKANWQKYVDTQKLYFKRDNQYILVTNEKIVESYPGPDGSTILFRNVPKYKFNNALTYYTDKDNVTCYQYDSISNPPYQALKYYDNILTVKNIPKNVQLCYPNFNRVGDTDIAFYPYHVNESNLYIRGLANNLSGYSITDKFFYYENGAYLELKANENNLFVIDVNKDYYTYQGYKAVAKIRPGYDYYVRSGTAAYGYKYTYVFTIKYGEVYTSYENTSEFLAGNTYIEQSTGKVFTIPLQTLYIIKGNDGYAPTIPAGTFPSGYYFYLDSETGEYKAYPGENLAVLGTMNYYYTPATANNLTSGTAYKRNPVTGEFEEIQALFTFDVKGQYFTYDGQDFTRYEHRIVKPKGTVVRLEDGTTTTLKGQYYSSNNFNEFGWTCDLDSPELLNFWFDFLDTEGELGKYSVQRIGSRPKSENNSDVTAIYYRETPTVIFVGPEDDIEEQKSQKPGYTFVRCPDYVEELFTISCQRKSAKDTVDSLLYNHTYCTETITLTTLPVYHLLPNTRIFVYDEKSGINGEYIVSKFTIPLAYNGTMSITATKAVERLF